MKKIWVLCGGPSTEFEVSVNSGRVICEEIDLKKNRVRPVVITRLGRWIIGGRELASEADRTYLDAYFERATSPNMTVSSANISAALKQMTTEHVDCAVLALHGQYGEDGRMQGFLEMAGIPYTGARCLSSALAFNKILSLDVFRRAGLTTPKGVHITKTNRKAAVAAAKELAYPVFVKPVCGGSSVGLTLVHKASELNAAIDAALTTDEEALVESRVDGVEVSCGVLDVVKGDKVETITLPPTEIRPMEAEFFDYTAKYVAGKSKEITPADLPKKVLAAIQECALNAHRALGCEGVSRTDMIIPSKEPRTPVVLETNTLPGMTRTSLLPQQCAATGIKFGEFVQGMIDHAIHRHKTRRH
ncbi:MAG: D-alanine--D-alanine ligase [Candidatus Sumerlaeaceae bacterium]|nr:D-alanine--D-alanine ligase [Candidatus Sumerlaeaceae bacterium]